MKLLLVLLFLLFWPVYGLHNLLINGSTSVTLTTEDSMSVSALFEDPGNIASGGFYYDLNGNGHIDTQEPVMSYIRMIDGNFDDEDESLNGSYLMNDEPVTVTGQFLAYAEDNGVADTISMTVNSVSTSYSISGAIATPLNQPHLMVMAMYEDTIAHHEHIFGDFTDASGNYTISLPDNLGNRWWRLIILDFANVAPLYMSPMDSVFVSGYMNKNLAMISALPDTCTISGYIRDEFGNPLAGPSRIMSVVMAQTFFGFRPGSSNASGYYNLKVRGDTSWCYHSVDAEIIDQYYPEYMDPAEIDTIMVGQTPPYSIVINLKAYTTTNTIAGHIYLDGLPYDKARIETNSSIGESYTKSYSDGHYSIPVSDSLVDLYTIAVSDESVPVGYTVAEGDQNAAAGATNVDFHLVPLGIAENHIKSIDETIKIYPNPFKEITDIRLQIANNSATDLRIFDITGRTVKQFDNKTIKLSDHIIWDGTDDSGNNLPSGVYLYHLRINNEKYYGKIIRLE